MLRFQIGETNRRGITKINFGFFNFLSFNIKSVNQLSSFKVESFGPVVSSFSLSEDEFVRSGIAYMY